MSTNTVKGVAAVAIEVAAAHISKPFQWCRGAYEEPQWNPIEEKMVTAACLVGAIWLGEQHVANEGMLLADDIDRDDVNDCIMAECVDAIGRESGYNSVGNEALLINWNDSQRDKRTVIRMLNGVAKRLRKEVQ